MPKIDFWDISVKSEPKSKKIFLVILFINMNKTKQKKNKKIVSKSFYHKKVIFGKAPSGSHRIGPSGQEKKIRKIWKEDSLINYKNSEKVVFDKNYN
jgi:hypothetical protein